MSSWTDPHRAELVAAYRQSGVGQDEFCRGLLQRGIRLSPRTLRAWIARLEPPAGALAECLEVVDRALSDLRRIRRMLAGLVRTDVPAQTGIGTALEGGMPPGASQVVRDLSPPSHGEAPENSADSKSVNSPGSVPIGKANDDVPPARPAPKPLGAALLNRNALLDTLPTLPAAVPKRRGIVWSI